MAAGERSLLLVLLLVLISADLTSGQQAQCATTCHAVDCDSPSLRYGKFCGVGHGGCAGEKPCDSVDACCKRHDDCVMKLGVMANSCHRKFIKCLDKNQNNKDGFSRACPYSVVVPTMKQGIQLAMMFSSMANRQQEL